jgi:hypothetical protein
MDHRTPHGVSSRLVAPLSEKCPDPLSPCMGNRTLVIDLPIQAHQQIDGCDFGVTGGQLTSLIQIFVRQVFNRVSKNFQSSTRLWSNPSSRLTVSLDARDPARNRSCYAARRCRHSPLGPRCPNTASLVKIVSLGTNLEFGKPESVFGTRKVRTPSSDSV